MNISFFLIVYGIRNEYFFLFNCSRFKLHTSVNVEESQDPENGDRYLLELAVEDFQAKDIRRLSVYLFRPKNTKRLCYPKNFQWKKDAMVHFILTGEFVYTC